MDETVAQLQPLQQQQQQQQQQHKSSYQKLLFQSSPQDPAESKSDFLLSRYESAAVQSDTTEMGSDTDKEILQTDSESDIQSENEPEIQSEETISHEPDTERQTEDPEAKPETDMEDQPREQPAAESPKSQHDETLPEASMKTLEVPEVLFDDNGAVEAIQEDELDQEATHQMTSGKDAPASEAEEQPEHNQEELSEAETNAEPDCQPEVQPEAEIQQEAEPAELREVEPCEQEQIGSDDAATKHAVEEAEEEQIREQFEGNPESGYTEAQAEAEEQPEVSPLEAEREAIKPEELPDAQQAEEEQQANPTSQPDAQSNAEIDAQLPSQLLQHRTSRQDFIIPPASRVIRPQQPSCKLTMLSSLRRTSNVSSRSSTVLSLPYPIEQCGADMQRAFPGQIGRYYVTNAYCYAYACNRMSIEMAAESMGFEKRDFWGEVRPPDGEKKQQQQQQQQQQQEQQSQESVVSGKSIERRMDDLERDLFRDPRLTLMIIKPDRMNWNKLGNCLVFERCHPHRHYIADKWQMFLTLRRSSTLRHMQMTTASGKPFDFRWFILYTANPGYYQRDLMQYLDSHPGIYILKRTNYSQGIGIQIYRAERPNTVDRIRTCIGNRASLNQFVLQKYIERPLLIDKRKFDLRVYMMLLSCKRPSTSNGTGFEYSYFAFCYPGYVKLSCYPYNKVSRDLHVHLTNQFVQKQRWTMYTRVKEATTWFPDELNAYLNKRGRAETDWCKNTLYNRIRAIVGYVAAAFRPHLESNASPASVFRLYGPDFIVDEDLNVWLLEVNTFPAYAKNTAALSGSIRNMWREAVTIATEATLRYRNRLPVSGLTSMRNFQLAYSSEDPGLLSELVKQSFA
ncbi:hypothetical protein BOX15_Mlig030802g1 [Macrostomum lignano]|uniref:TTL domain-containing protein n=3 Tax=Macrostomum lignano TaxID=282301 RepID=A0A267FGR8_9PLAT|nr:hypothetical protein BOX15_Mlig030802g1 [Macrostomum lignano]